MKWIFSMLLFAIPVFGIQAQKLATNNKNVEKSGQEKLVKPEKAKTEIDSAGANETNIEGTGMTTAKDIPADKLDRNPNQEDNTSKARTEPVIPSKN